MGKQFSIRDVIMTGKPNIKGRILIVDDDKRVITMIARYLIKAGYDVESATNGMEALELYRRSRERKPIDAIIVDLNLPDSIRGDEIMKHIIELDDSAIGIISSGYHNDPVVQNYDQHGFSAVLKKPYPLKDLVKTIEKLLEK